METFSCSYCVDNAFSAPTEVLILNHIKRVHSLDPGFSIQCSFAGCSRTFSNFRTYQNHRLTHREQVDREQVIVTDQGADGNLDHDTLGRAEQSPSDYGTGDYSQNHDGVAGELGLEVNTTLSSLTDVDMQTYAAKWILKTSEARSLTRTATMGIVEDASDFIDFVTDSLRVKLTQEFKTDLEVLSRIDQIFQNHFTHPFDNLKSFHQLLQCYKTKFNLIEPQRIILKESSTLRLSGRRRKVVTTKTDMFYVPLLETLASQLENKTILDQVVKNCERLSEDILHDYCDARQFQEHLLFSRYRMSLQLILYYDELELCNPLGSRRGKHKIGAFYYAIGNLSPRLRSKVKHIQLLLLAKYSSVQEFGIDRLLQPIVKDIKQLESTGITIHVRGEQYTFHGTVTVISADNPASALLGGFKQSASAFRFCRHCMGTGEDIQTKFVESYYRLRSIAEHSKHCEILGDEGLSIPDQQFFSTLFGVNRRSILNDLSYFNVASGALVPDIMHDILEGMLPLEVKHMLKVFVIDEKLITLMEIDELIQALNIRSIDGEKPSAINGISLTAPGINIQQHAIQMWTLGRFLPLAIGYLVQEDNEFWINFLCLLDIMDIIFARSIPKNICGYLESLISDHHHEFLDLYPHVSVTMKMHSILHMPRLISEFGPLINYWTTRFEAKHKYFKHLANILGNFKNICYSLALRHQLYQCYLNLNSNIFEDEIEVGPGSIVEQPSSEMWGARTTLSTSSHTLFKANWVEINGIKYQCPCAIIVGEYDDKLKFGSVLDIFVDKKTVYFEFIPLITKEFNNHIHAYVLTSPPETDRFLIKQDDLLDFHSFGLYRSHTLSSNPNLLYIVPRCNIYVS